jgi:hypothetical protein
LNFAFLRNIAVHFAPVVYYSCPLTLLLGFVVSSHLPHSSLVDRQKSRISHVRHPAAVAASEDHEGAGATFAADARVFPQFVLKQGEAEFECLRRRAFFAEERLENEV